jgi:hypothetical protein
MRIKQVVELASAFVVGMLYLAACCGVSKAVADSIVAGIDVTHLPICPCSSYGKSRNNL